MPLADLFTSLAPEEEEGVETYSRYGLGPYTRTNLNVDEDVGRKTLDIVQPGLEFKPTQIFRNLRSDVGNFASGMAAVAAYPIFHYDKVFRALQDPGATAAFIGKTIVQGYKDSYTPKPGEGIPHMLLRRFYEHPFETLMDASALAQITTGAGKAAVAAAAKSPLVSAASATRATAMFDAVGKRAMMMDPLTIAQKTGAFIGEMAVPDVVKSFRINAQLADSVAQRNAILHHNTAQMQRETDKIFSGLNEAEKMAFHPYVAGRINFDRPVGQQLMDATGHWVPIKGDTIRPEILEQARQKYIPLQQEFERMLNLHPEQVMTRAGANAYHQVKDFLGKNFDPFNPSVQDYINNSVKKALEENQAHRLRRASGEMMNALDIAKERQYRRSVEQSVEFGIFKSISDAERMIPKPKTTTVEEALSMMGPQGGIYFPHDAELYNRGQSTIKGILGKLHQALPYKYNQMALFRANVLEHQDPAKTLLRSYATYAEAKTWLEIARDAVEEEIGKGKAFRMNKKWQFATDKDVIAGTHQPFHPGMILTDKLIEDDAQRLLIRAYESIADSEIPEVGKLTIEAVSGPKSLQGSGPTAPKGPPGATPIGDLNYADIIAKMVQQAEKGPIYKFKKEIPIYKVETSLGHTIKAFRNSMEPSSNPIVQAIDRATSFWNWTNLNLRASRLLNNIGGNIFFVGIQGVHPFSVSGINTIVAMGRALKAKMGFGSETGAKIAKIFDLPGVRSGSLQTSFADSAGSFGESMRTIGKESGRAKRIATAPLRGLGWWGEKIATLNESIEAAYRGASLYYAMSKNATQRAQRMGTRMGRVLDLSETIETLSKQNAAVTMKMPEYRAALKEVNRYLHDYNRVTPFERMMVRRIFPYYKFFKHSTELLLRYPFEHPFQAQVMRSLGEAAKRDYKDIAAQWGLDWKKDVQPYLQDSIPIYATNDEKTGQPVMWTYSTLGANPFSQMTGNVSEQMLQLLNPVVKLAFESGTGINLFTRQRYRGTLSSFTGREYNPRTGLIEDSFHHPSYGEAFLRSFWPYVMVRDMVANGRVPTDTASLLAMAANSRNAWELDPVMGTPVMRPQASKLQPLLRFAGIGISPVQQPTAQQKQSRQTVISGQLNTLFQRYPEERARILRTMNEVANEVALEYFRKQRR